MSQIRVKQYAVVEKYSNGCIAVINENFLSWFQQNMQAFKYVEVHNISYCGIQLESGKHIDVMCIYTKPYQRFEDAYYMVVDKPEELSLNDCYELLKEQAF